MESTPNVPERKKHKSKLPEKEIIIGTHNGTFHCDEVLACSLLKHVPEYSNATIVRTRDPNELQKCDIVVDVGGVYDPVAHRYDHHQRSFDHTMHSLNKDYPWTTKLSSAGLVYFHFGRKIINSILKLPVDSLKTDILYKKMYENFIEEIDAIDNGIKACDAKRHQYRIATDISSRIKRLNPPWNEPDVNERSSFENARKVVMDSFLDILTSYFKVWLPARESVQKAVVFRQTVHSSGEILELSDGCCPWKEHLSELEVELKVEPSIKFVIYTDLNDNWRVQCVPISPHSFESRVPLLQEWCGIRDEELSEVSGIPDCIFVHANGFIGGNKTREGALQMAKKTLKAKDDWKLIS